MRLFSNVLCHKTHWSTVLGNISCSSAGNIVIRECVEDTYWDQNRSLIIKLSGQGTVSNCWAHFWIKYRTATHFFSFLVYFFSSIDLNFNFLNYVAFFSHLCAVQWQSKLIWNYYFPSIVLFIVKIWKIANFISTQFLDSVSSVLKKNLMTVVKPPSYKIMYL